MDTKKPKPKNKTARRVTRYQRNIQEIQIDDLKTAVSSLAQLILALCAEQSALREAVERLDRNACTVEQAVVTPVGEQPGAEHVDSTLTDSELMS